MATAPLFSSAQIEDVYRYRLDRSWHPDAPPLLWVMLNPSTADERVDDATIRKCVGFARQSGYGSIIVVNLFALRSRDPLALAKAHDPVGPRNDKTIGLTCVGLPKNARVIVGWGANLERAALRHLRPRAERTIAVIKHWWEGEICCLGLTKAGSPVHPLMIGYSTPFQKYEPKEPQCF